jgi:hypothetical protein
MEMGRWPRRNAIKTNLNSSSLPRENVKQANWVMKPNLFPHKQEWAWNKSL